MKIYVKAADDDIVYTTKSGRGKVKRIDFLNGDKVYDAIILDRYNDEYSEAYDTLEEAMSFVDKYEARYQWGLSKQPEFDEWYQSLSPEVKEDFDKYNLRNMDRIDICCDYESMLDYIDYVKSGRKPKWARSMNLSDKEFHDMTNYDGII
jgi:hypothetical protein